MANKHDWFHTWFGQDYLLAYSHRSDAQAQAEVEFIKSLVNAHIESGESVRVLDMTCGSGRHLLAFKKWGSLAIGADLSEALLRAALSRGPSLRGSLVRYDMRRFCFAPHSFHLITNLFTSIGYFERDEETANVFQEAAQTLIPNGIFVLDYFNPDLILSHLKPETTRSENELTIRETRKFDQSSSRILKNITITDCNSSRSYKESVRLFSVSEILAFFSLAGLEVVAQYGDFTGAPFTSASPRLIVVAKKSSHG